jgi:hypothetical protein
MKNLPKTTLAVLGIGLVSCGLFCQQAQATQINGTINFTGFVTLSKNPVMNTSSLVFSGPTFTTLGTGDFASIPSGTSVFPFADLTFNDNTLETNSPFLFWDFQVNGTTYQWLLEPPSFPYFLASGNVTLGHGGPNPRPWSFTVSGPGSAAASGFDDTPGGTFTLSGTGTAAHLVFAGSFSVGSAVPDGGMTVALLGLALAGVAVLRRKLRAS